MVGYKVLTPCGEIYVRLQDEDIIEKLFLKRYLKEVKNYPQSFDVTVFYRDNIFNRDKEYNFYKKINKNSFEIRLYYHEIKGIVLLDKFKKHAIVIGETKYDAIQLLKAYILKLFSEIFVVKGAYSSHCSCIEKNKKGILFLGNGNGGKSTSFFSSLIYGNENYSALSDDFVMINKNGNSLYANSLPIKSCFRPQSQQFIKNYSCNSLISNENYPGKGDQYYIDYETYFAKKHVEFSKIEVIVFLNKDINNTECQLTPLKNQKELAIALAKNITQFKTNKVDVDMLNFIEFIVENIDCYEITLPDDMRKFYNIIDGLLNVY